MKQVSFWVAVMFGLLALGKLVELSGAPFVGLIIWTLAIIWISTGFYRVRETSRLICGTAELMFGTIGVFLVLFSFYKNSQGVSDGPLIVRVALMLAAVYVVVRSLDNIGVGLKGTPLEGRWRKLLMFE
jgi:hypothetical protein